MESSLCGGLVGSDIHGFHTMDDLDIPNIMFEAKSRWLRPNEIHAILFNYKYFTINVKPVNLPKGGTIVLFDRKKLRNFRKDGHSWKKKKDGKTVKEAHEHLKVGTEERIHVYYAHGEDNPNFVRRCYWLLDKALEHIVLVHYREIQELQGSPVTPVNTISRSDVSDSSASQYLSGGSDSRANQMNHSDLKECTESGDIINATNYEMRLREINTLDWDELLASGNPNGTTLSTKEQTPILQQYQQHAACNLESDGNSFVVNQSLADTLTSRNNVDYVAGSGSSGFSPLSMFLPSMGTQLAQDGEYTKYNMGTAGAIDSLAKDGLQSQDSFGKWMNDIIVDSPVSADDPSLKSSGPTGHDSFMSSAAVTQEGSFPSQIFCITDMSPSWAYSTEETKVLVVGFFHQEYQHLSKSNIFCVCGDSCVSAEIIQSGVFRVVVSPHSAGLASLYMSIDCCTPISQVLNFEFRPPAFTNLTVKEDKSQWDMFRVQMRLGHLLFSTSKSLDLFSSKISPISLKEGKKFATKYSNITDSWAYFNKLIEDGRISFERAKDSLFELFLKSRLKEWLLERVVEGSKTCERDAQGQGVLHLCAILDYTWAVYPFSCCGMSLDFRDKFGWTALHWAAYYGREKMVAALLSAGAKPNLVTDPTSENPAGCIAAELAAKQGFEGLAAFLSEKALIQQFEDMKRAGNVGGSLETSTAQILNPTNVSEEEIYLKDTLTAYRTAADAAARIQVAFRERSLKQRTKAAEHLNPEIQARYIVAAMKIQHAFRNYETRKKMVAAAQIQHRFRAWKLRKEFLNMRRQAIKIQAAFRAFQARKEYRKIMWSVGVLEKAILRWRLKRKGLRGVKVEIKEPDNGHNPGSDTEEDFYRDSRKQAEERVEKAVVRVQAMFRSRQVQQEYRRMKLTHAQAEYEYAESTDPHAYMS